MAETPRDNDDERSVEESGLDGCAEDVGESEVHLVVPSLVNGCNMLGGLFDNGNQDQTNEATLISKTSCGGTGSTYASLI